MKLDLNCLLERKVLFAQKAVLIKCSEIAYDKHETEKDKEDVDRSFRRFKEMGFEVIERFEDKKTDTQVYVASNEKIIAKIYRGSDSDIDWAQNFKFKKVEPKDCATTRIKEGVEVHQGMHEQVCSIFDPVASYITSIPYYRNKKLFGTGHSLGGGDIQIDCLLFDNIVPYNFVLPIANPRSLDKDGAKLINKRFKGRFCRITNNADIVTKVPLRTQGFKHVKYEDYIDSFGIIHVGGLFQVFGFIDWVWGAASGLVRENTGVIDCHHPCNYFNPYAKKAKSSERLAIWPNYR